MKLDQVEQHSHHTMMITDGPNGNDWRLYRRNDDKTWEAKIALDWRPVYQAKDLEQAFQQQRNPGNDRV